MKKEAEANGWNYRPGLLERLGLGYYRWLHSQRPAHGLPLPEKEWNRRLNRLTYIGMAVAFLAGALATLAAVYFAEPFDNDPGYEKYLWQGIITVAFAAIELGVLFWFSLRTVYLISELTARHLLHHEDEILPDAVRVMNILCRAALEAPDPVLKVLGVDPLAKISKRQLLLTSLLYKAKVFLSNFVAKLVLRKILSRAAVRVSVDYISVPITALWNAYVMLLVVREARLRLFGNLLANFVAEQARQLAAANQWTPAQQTVCLRAVANAVVLTQNSHPNMVALLTRLHHVLETEPAADYDNWTLFKQAVAEAKDELRFVYFDLLAISAAFDGSLSRLEKKALAEVFGNHANVYFDRIQKLTRLLRNGRLEEVKKLCQLDFQPG